MPRGMDGTVRGECLALFANILPSMWFQILYTCRADKVSQASALVVLQRPLLIDQGQLLLLMEQAHSPPDPKKNATIAILSVSDSRLHSCRRVLHAVLVL